jgi:hypothetical protein
MRKGNSLLVRSAKTSDYQRLVSEVSVLLEEARRTSVRAVNTVLTTTYWEDRAKDCGV